MDALEKVSLNKIKLGKNCRLDISDDEIAGLMESIKSEGLLQPIGLVKRGSGFEVCFGNRRFLAVSKLGMKTIPAVIVKDDARSSVDIKNLTENVQRRNITLQEIGRYIEMLIKEGLTRKEIAVRMGVPHQYVETAITAYQQVPRKFREDIQATTGTQKLKPGKISLSAVRRIETARKKHRLTPEEKIKLYQVAKSDNFNAADVDQYCSEIKKNSLRAPDQITKAVKESRKELRFSLLIDPAHYERLMKKHVENGSFRSFTAIVKAKLNDKLSDKIPVE